MNLTIVQSQTAGEVVVSWLSLEHGGPISITFPATLVSAWQVTPLGVAESVNSLYTFLIHHASSVAPSVALPTLYPLDQALWDEFLVSFPAINQQVSQSALAASVQSGAPPQSLGAREFFRVVEDRTIDSDGDGVPDWVEFMVAGQAGHPNQSLANAFSRDSDGNGISDGSEMDTDQDGITDDRDTAASDPFINWSQGPHHSSPRYACFPAASPSGAAALMVNSRGEVLFPTSVWAGGSSQNLITNSDDLEGCLALGMNNNGQIIGYGLPKLVPRNGPVGSPVLLVFWSHKGATPQRVFKPLPDDEKDSAIIAWSDLVGLPGDNLLSDEGYFYARSSESPPAVKRWHYDAQSESFSYQAAAHEALRYVANPGVSWGVDGDQTVVRGAGNDNNIPVQVMRFGLLPGGDVTVFSSPKCWKTIDGQWTPAPSIELFSILDGATNGVILQSRALWNNRVFQGLFEETTQATAEEENPQQKPSAAPGIDASWGSAGFTDSSSNGWIVGGRPAGPAWESLLSLPVVVEDDVFATGVDSHSAASTAPRLASMGRFWIMVPEGGANTVRFRAPASPESVLTIDFPDFISQDPVVQTSAESEVTFTTSRNNQPSIEGFATFSLGGQPSLSTPVGFKVMKKREIKVTVWPVGLNYVDEQGVPRIDTAEIIPTEQEITDYLNDIYGPQINLTFEVDLRGETSPTSGQNAPYGSNWDLADTLGAGVGLNGHFDVFSSDSPAVLSLEQDQLSGAGRLDQLADINIYLIGGGEKKGRVIKAHRMSDGQLSPVSNLTPILGWTHSESRRIWLDGTTAQLADLERLEENLLATMAHEIGHIVIGAGHPDAYEDPDDSDVQGAAPLPMSYRQARLMYSTEVSGNPNKLLVKGEWDKAELWLEARENP